MSTLEFNEIYKKYERELYGFIYTIARRDSFYAEDILQNTMTSAYKYINTLKSEDKLKPWIFSIARKEAARFFHKESNYMGTNINYIEDISEYNSQELAEVDFSVEFLADDAFIKMLSGLSEEEQSIIFLKYNYGMKLSEIAETWGANKNSIKSIHLRSMKKLKKMVDKEGNQIEYKE